MSLNESIVEAAALAWFGELGYTDGRNAYVAHGNPVPVKARLSTLVP